MSSGSGTRCIVASIFVGRRGIAMHAISGIDIALWEVKGKALGKPVCELIGTVQHDRIRAYASRLMPDTTEEVTEARFGAPRAGLHSGQAGWGHWGRIPSMTSAWPGPPARPVATTSRS